MILDGAGVELYVSVPFRGSCSEMELHLVSTLKSECFRPLSGFVF